MLFKHLISDQIYKFQLNIKGDSFHTGIYMQLEF